MKKYSYIGLGALTTVLATLSIVTFAGYTPKAQYKELHANFEISLTKAYDDYEELLLFMEKQAVDKQDYDEAKRLQTTRENRTNWKIDFMNPL